MEAPLFILGNGNQKKEEEPTEITRRIGRWTKKRRKPEAFKKLEQWLAIAQLVPGRDDAQCYSRWNKTLKWNKRKQMKSRLEQE
jgi:hypothetical protein